MYKCSICNLVVDKIPADAVQIGRAMGGNTVLYRFSDGGMHLLVPTNTGRKSSRSRTAAGN